MKKILIVGGVAGGASAAARIRRLDEQAEIILFEKDEHISFANCGLPYHIGEVITERSKLIVQTPEAMNRRFRIDVRNNSTVTAVDTQAKTVQVTSADKGEYTESYDILVLAPGVEPARLPVPNSAPDKVMNLRNIPDIDRIKQAMSQQGINAVAVVGGGFVGVEMAENLREAGAQVTLIEAMDHILPPFDRELAVLLEEELRRSGVVLHLGKKLESIEDAGDNAVLRLQDGMVLEAQLVISAIGVTPATGFLKDSGIPLGSKGHILTDEHMCTEVEDVYAVGDAVEVTDFVTGLPTAIPLAGPANKQGRIAADNICGLPHSYNGTQGTAIIKVFRLTGACTGANEGTLRRLSIPYTAIYTHPFSHATYYPGAVQMSCKLLFSPEGKILGCQMVGQKGVDKRLDVVATALRLGANVTDLAELELAYAPPFSSAKDPVNMLGYIAQNILEGNANLVDYQYVLKRDLDDTLLLDTRTKEEFNRGHLEGAINIPVDELRERLDELDKSKEIIQYCQVGIRGHVAQRILSQHGFKLKNVSGGYLTLSRQMATE